MTPTEGAGIVLCRYTMETETWLAIVSDNNKNNNNNGIWQVSASMNNTQQQYKKRLVATAQVACPSDNSRTGKTASRTVIGHCTGCGGPSGRDKVGALQTRRRQGRWGVGYVDTAAAAAAAEDTTAQKRKGQRLAGWQQSISGTRCLWRVALALRTRWRLDRALS
jgi:Pyruvate/2-oxoacid:ferredoxin oxidoreductase delta subunit